MLDGALRIRPAQLRRLELAEQHEVVAPRQMSNSLLDNFFVRPCLGERPHVHEIGAGETFHLGEGRPQVAGQPLDDLCAPALLELPPKYVPSDLPVKKHQLLVHGLRRALLGTVDPGLQFREPFDVPSRSVGKRWRC